MPSALWRTSGAAAIVCGVATALVLNGADAEGVPEQSRLKPQPLHASASQRLQHVAFGHHA
eukprot:5549008-Prymnesium_polylepis.1